MIVKTVIKQEKCVKYSYIYNIKPYKGYIVLQLCRSQL